MSFPDTYLTRVAGRALARTRSGRMVLIEPRGDPKTLGERVTALMPEGDDIHYVVEPGCLHSFPVDPSPRACVRAGLGGHRYPHMAHAPMSDLPPPPVLSPSVVPAVEPSASWSYECSEAYFSPRVVRPTGIPEVSIRAAPNAPSVVEGTCDGGHSWAPIATDAPIRSCHAGICRLGNLIWAGRTAWRRFENLVRLDHEEPHDPMVRSVGRASARANAATSIEQGMMTIARHDVGDTHRDVYRGRSCFPNAELRGATDAVSVFASWSGMGIVVHATGQCTAYQGAVSRTFPMTDGSMLVAEDDGYVMHVRRDGTFSELAFACERELALGERDGVPGVVCVHHDRRSARFYGFDDTRVELPYPADDAATCRTTPRGGLRFRLGDDAFLYEFRLEGSSLCVAGRFA